MDREEFLRQLERWVELFRRESIILFDKGLGPDELMATAITITDALLSAEIRANNRKVLEVPGTRARFPHN